MSHRKEQLESSLKRAVSAVLQRQLADPRVSGLVTVTRVAAGEDLRDATVFISVLPQKHESRAIYGLKHAAGHIQSLVADHVRMRSVPHLEFKLDRSIKTQARTLAAIQRGIRRENKAARRAPAKPEASAPDPATALKPGASAPDSPPPTGPARRSRAGRRSNPEVDPS